MILLWMVLGLLDGGTAADGIGPEPDVLTTGRRRIGAFVKRGGVGSLRGRVR